MKITLAQINPTVGALENNYNKIKDIIDRYSYQCDIIVFPEMVLTGYPPQDLLLDVSFINKTEKLLLKLAKIRSNATIIIGTIRRYNGKLFNTAAILQNQEIYAYRDKSNLPTYDIFDEVRYFSHAESNKPVEIIINNQTYKFGIQICEDLWDDQYDIKVSEQLCNQGAKFIINISASPFHLGRLVERSKIIRDKCKRLNLYFIYCNLIGGQDELVFDGQSCVMNPEGDMLLLYPAFKEKVKVFNIENLMPISIYNDSEEEQIYNALSLGIKDYFDKTGHSKAVIGLSGGIDSALTAVIAQNALGSKNVIGLSMPSIYSSDHSIKDAKALAKNIGISFEIISIKEIHQKMLLDLSPIFNVSEEELAEQNLQARIRGNILMYTANKKNALLLNTGNKTEMALGYCTMYGDMAGALAVISDLNKLQVYSLARWINNSREEEVIPKNSISKLPSAELKLHQVDPFDYEIVSPLVDFLIHEPEKFNKLEQEGYDPILIKDLLQKIRLSEYKRRQAPPGIRVSSKAFGIGRRFPIVNAYGT